MNNEELNELCKRNAELVLAGMEDCEGCDDLRKLFAIARTERIEAEDLLAKVRTHYDDAMRELTSMTKERDTYKRRAEEYRSGLEKVRHAVNWVMEQ